LKDCILGCLHLVTQLCILTVPNPSPMSVILRKKPLANGSFRLFLDIHENGVRRKEYLDLRLGKDKHSNKETLRLAEQIRLHREYELATLPVGVTPSYVKDLDFIKYYQEVMKRKGRSWKSVLHTLIEFTGGSIKMSEVREKWLDSYKDFLLSKVKRNSADTYFAKVKATLSLAVRDGLIQYNPADRVDGIGRIRDNPKYLTSEDLQKLAKTPCSNPEVKRAFLFACFTGLRYGDLKRLRRDAIQNNCISIIQEKTGRSISLPLHESLPDLISVGSGEASPFVFNLPRSHGNMWKILRKWGECAGVSTPLSAHVARHTFATQMLTHHGNIYVIKDLLGHSSLAHTQVYAKVVDSLRTDAINSLPPLVLVDSE
jgi:integrase